MGKMKVAILGAGHIAGKMAEALTGIGEEVTLYAVASRSIEKATAFANQWNFEKAYGTYEELAMDREVDLVYIATPHSEHYKNAYLCLSHGRNCLVEKAFCANLSQAKKLIECAKEHHVLLAEAMWTRYQPSKDLIRDALKTGKIGNPHYLEADFSVPIVGVERLTNPALAGGSLLDLGVYSLTVPAMYFGTDITSVKSSVVKTETGVDATLTAFLTYADGKMARVKSSAVDPNSNYAKIVGDRGYMLFGPINVPEKIEIYDVNGVLQETIPCPILVNGYEYQVLECKRMLETGRIETESMPWSETLRLMGWMDSLRDHAGIQYPFETKEEIDHPDLTVWGVSDAFDDSNPWDRSNTRSFLRVYDTETEECTTLATFEEVIEAPNWSHDGKFLTYNSNGRIYRYDLASGKSTEVDSGALKKINNDHVLSSDDIMIAVSDETLIDGKSRIYMVPLAGGEPILVTKEAPSYLHGWSPDKSKFCFCAERNGEYDIYEIQADGTGEKQLTTAPCLNDGSEYDSTGEWIYFNSVRTGLMQAWKMRADGTEQTALTTDSHLNTWFPHISPDGTKIVMISYRKGDLWPGDHVPNKTVELRLMNADGTNLRTILELFGGQGTINVNSWAPDSKRVAFVSYEKK